MSEVDYARKKRSPNWIASEKHILISLVEKYHSDVENKRTDSMNMRQKCAAWEKLAAEFNAVTSHSHRSVSNLKLAWENMKKAAKKESANARMELFKTEFEYEQLSENTCEENVLLRLVNGEWRKEVASPLILELVNGEWTSFSPKMLKKQLAAPLLLELVNGEWTSFSPKMLKKQLAAPLLVSPGSSMPETSNEKHSPSSSKPGPSKLVKWSNRKRPSSNSENSASILIQKKIDAIDQEMDFSAKEHELNKYLKEQECYLKEKDFQLKEQQYGLNELDHQLKERELILKDEFIKQEKLKTKLLLLQLRRERRY
ncbi:hypothetical protein C0J52_18843 [Blattella germanica]|nr:hypothetical protein C0J52_18843 [Blattella germanica]